MNKRAQLSYERRRLGLHEPSPAVLEDDNTAGPVAADPDAMERPPLPAIVEPYDE